MKTLDNTNMTAIHTIHWSHVPNELALPSTPYREFRFTAIWPAPVDHDACFTHAGFSDFKDSDENWDLEFERIVVRLLSRLSKYGEPVVIQKVEFWRPFLDRLLRKETVASLFDQILAPSRDDQFPDCVVGFGDPPKIILRTGMGHSIFWLTYSREASMDLDELIRFLAEGRGISRTELEWKHLLPFFKKENGSIER